MCVFISHMYLGVGLLVDMLTQCLRFREQLNCLPKQCVPFYISTCDVWVTFFPHANQFQFCLPVTAATLVDVKRYCVVVLQFPINNNAEHLFLAIFFHGNLFMSNFLNKFLSSNHLPILLSLFYFYIVVVFAIHWHESAMDLHVFPILIPAPASLPIIPSLWVFPVHHPWALVSCIQPGLVICFTLDTHSFYFIYLLLAVLGLHYCTDFLWLWWVGATL